MAQLKTQDIIQGSKIQYKDFNVRKADMTIFIKKNNFSFLEIITESYKDSWGDVTAKWSVAYIIDDAPIIEKPKKKYIKF